MTSGGATRARATIVAAVAIATAAALWALACGSSYGEDPKLAEEAGSLLDAADGSAAEAAAPVDPCAHAVPVAPPALDDEPNATKQLAPFLVAVDSFNVVQSAGFDLDGTCTCTTGAAAAHGGASSCVTTTPSCDQDGGVDNKYGEVLEQYSKLYGFDLQSLFGVNARSRAARLHSSSRSASTTVSRTTSRSRSVSCPPEVSSTVQAAGARRPTPMAAPLRRDGVGTIAGRSTRTR